MIQLIFCLTRLMRGLRQEPDLWKRRQRAELKTFARTAMAASRYHQARLASVGMRPEDLVEPEQLDRLPIMERSDLQQKLDEIATPAANARGTRTMYTSGSCGVPLETRVTREEAVIRQALQLRARLLAGLKPWYREAVIGSFAPRTPSPGRYPIWQRILYVSATRDGAELLAELRAFAPDYLVAFPSTLLRFGEEPGLRVRLVTTGSEVLEPGVRTTLERRFHAPVRDIYGTIETGLLGFQCAVGEGYHLNADIVHFEFRPVEGLEGGLEILVTPLYSRAVPLVRYRLGDIVRPMPGPCPCGVTLPRIAAIEGRRDDWLVRQDRREVPPSTIRALFRGRLHPTAYRVTQCPDGHVLLELAPGRLNESTAEHLADSLKSIVQQSVDLQIMTAIPPEPSGKLRAIRRLLQA